MAAGPEALRALLKRIEAVEVEEQRIWQTLVEEDLLPEWWLGNPYAEIDIWDGEIKENIRKRIEEWGKPPSLQDRMNRLFE